MKKKQSRILSIVGACAVLAVLLVQGIAPAHSETSTSTNAVNVSATVPAQGGGGVPEPAPAPPAPPPVNPLAISQVTTTPLSGTSYKITWTTNKAATSRIDYGLTLNYELNNQTDAQLVSQHSITLTNLIPNTQYFAKATSQAGGETAIQTNITFVTPAQSFVPLIISDVTVSTETAGEITVSWSTNKTAEGSVRMIKTATLESEMKLVPAANQQTITFSNLDPLTNYTIVVIATTASETTTHQTNATTTGNPPTISNVAVTTPIDTKAVFTWNTAMPATTELYVGDTPGGPLTTFTHVDPTTKTDHAVELTQLIPGHTYEYRMVAQGQYGSDESSPTTFTMPDNTAPTILSVIVSQTTPTSATLLVTTNEPHQASAVVKKNEQATGKTSVDTPDFSLSHTITATELIPNTPHTFTISVQDQSGNTSLQDGVFTTKKDTTPPPNASDLSVQVLPQPSTPNDFQWFASLNWKNPTVADYQHTLIRYSYNTQPSLPTEGLSGGTSTQEARTINVERPKTATFPQVVYITLFVVDTSGNASSGITQSATLQKPENQPSNDQDNDSVPDELDNCPTTSNVDQSDQNGNGIGDACDVVGSPNKNDDDNDGVINEEDNCPDTPNQDQKDEDNDGTGDECEGPTTGVPKDIEYSPPQDDTDPKQKPEIQEDATNTQSPPASKPIIEDIKEFIGISSPKTNTLTINDITFTAVSHNLILRPFNNTVGILVGFDAGIVVPKSRLKQNMLVKQAQVQVGKDTYLLKETDSAFATSFIKKKGIEQAQLRIVYEDNTEHIVSFSLSGVLYGLISTTNQGDTMPITDATIELLSRDESVIPLKLLGQNNPTQPSKEGLYGFMIPNGQYKLRITKDGYRTETTEPFIVSNNIVNRSITLLLKPKKIIDAIDTKKTITQNALSVTERVQEKVVYNTKVAIRETVEFAENPDVEDLSENTVTPTVIAVAAVNSTAATGLPALARLLQLFFSQPLMLFNKRRRYGWGTVYDALTKNPVDLAYVRLIDAQTGRIIQTQVTDVQGRFSFFAEPGTYKIEATKQAYAFPTQYLKDITDDGRYVDVYHDEILSVGESTPISPNIPLDPGEKTMEGEHTLKRQFVLREIRFGISIIGIVVSAIITIIIPTPITISICTLHIALFFIMRRITIPPKPKGWGIVYNASNKAPIKQAVARIFDTQYNKLLDTQLTDSKGRYAFLASQRAYYVTYEKEGFEKKKSHVFDLTNKNEPQIIAEKVLLSPFSSLQQQNMITQTAKPNMQTAAVSLRSKKTQTEHSEHTNHFTPPTHPKTGEYWDGEGS